MAATILRGFDDQASALLVHDDGVAENVELLGDAHGPVAAVAENADLALGSHQPNLAYAMAYVNAPAPPRSDGGLIFLQRPQRLVSRGEPARGIAGGKPGLQPLA